MIPVFTYEGYQRLVSLRQAPGEIAGKVLAPVQGLWRTAERREDPKIGPYWLAFYFKPKPEQIAEWEGRRPDREARGKVAH